MTSYGVREVILLIIVAFLLPLLILFTCYGPVNAQGPEIQIGDDIDGEAADDYSGWSISLNAAGNIVAIGARFNDGNGIDAGQVRVYQNQFGIWTQIGADIDGEATEDDSGHSVSLNAAGNIVAIGAPGNDGNGDRAGQVRIYQNQSGIWTQIGDDIDGEAAGDNSGTSVSLNATGDIVAIGAYANGGNGPEAGQVRIYQYQSDTDIWTQIGGDIDGEAAGDYSGTSVSLNATGDIVAIGAYANGGNGPEAGHVRVYQNQSGIWTQIGDDIDGEAAGDWSGISVSLNGAGDIVAIGAPYNGMNITLAIYPGQVRVYQNVSGTWTQIGDDIDSETLDDLSGQSVSLNAAGDIIAIGGPHNSETGLLAGHVRVYQNQSGTWTQIGGDIDGEADKDESGWSVSLNAAGNIVAIGALFNDGNGTDAGHVRIFGPSYVTYLPVIFKNGTP